MRRLLLGSGATLIWERAVVHSPRASGGEGVILPYHGLLDPNVTAAGVGHARVSGP